LKTVLFADISYMSRTTKDPIALARVALEAGKEALPDYSCLKSPHRFTQPQLFALLVLKQFFRQDYRGVITWLTRWKELRHVLGLHCIPHYSTLCYAEHRLLKKGLLNASWTPPSSLQSGEA
jgi:hypothetical protein